MTVHHKVSITCPRCGMTAMKWWDSVVFNQRKGLPVFCSKECALRAAAEKNYGGICDCGDHAWARTSAGYVTLVDPEDAYHLTARSWSTGVTKNKTSAYARRMKDGRSISLHREVMGTTAKVDVDHMRDGQDNRKRYLREVSHQVNIQASERIRRNNTSGAANIYRPKGRIRWQVMINVGGKRIYVGSYAAMEDARVAALAAKYKYHSEGMEKRRD